MAHVSVGMVFSRLTVVDYVGTVAYAKRYLCRCTCGTETVVRAANLVSGDTKSCGCLRRERASEGTHHLTKTPIWRIWSAMRERCSNPRNKRYPRYGARGIRVCERWDSFENFYIDMGPRPSLKHTLERLDNDGHYCKENCTWATKSVQARNRRTTVRATFRGQTKAVADWCDELGLPYKKTISRISRQGWSVERAFTSA